MKRSIERIWQAVVNWFRRGIDRVLSYLAAGSPEFKRLIDRDHLGSELFMAVAAAVLLALVYALAFVTTPYSRLTTSLVFEQTSIRGTIADTDVNNISTPDVRVYGDGTMIYKVADSTHASRDYTLKSGKLTRAQMLALANKIDGLNFWSLPAENPATPIAQVTPTIFTVNEKSRAHTAAFTDNSPAKTNLVALFASIRPSASNDYVPPFIVLHAIKIQAAQLSSDAKLHDFNLTGLDLATVGGAGKIYRYPDSSAILTATGGEIYGYYKQNGNVYQLVIQTGYRSAV